MYFNNYTFTYEILNIYIMYNTQILFYQGISQGMSLKNTRGHTHLMALLRGENFFRAENKISRQEGSLNTSQAVLLSNA